VNAWMWVNDGCEEDGTDTAGLPRNERERGRRQTVYGVDEAGPQHREGLGMRTRGKWCRQVGPTRHMEMGRECVRMRAIANRWDPPVRRRERARATWLGWASWFHFSFSLNF
jgi:hypothetical protein